MMGFWDAVASAGPIQTIYTLLQTDNHTNNPSLNFFTCPMLFLMPNQQCQSTEGTMETEKCANINTLTKKPKVCKCINNQQAV